MTQENKIKVSQILTLHKEKIYFNEKVKSDIAIAFNPVFKDAFFKVYNSLIDDKDTEATIKAYVTELEAVLVPILIEENLRVSDIFAFDDKEAKAFSMSLKVLKELAGNKVTKEPVKAEKTRAKKVTEAPKAEHVTESADTLQKQADPVDNTNAVLDDF